VAVPHQSCGAKVVTRVEEEEGEKVVAQVKGQILLVEICRENKSHSLSDS
jgi:hypothetical protein